VFDIPLHCKLSTFTSNYAKGSIKVKGKCKTTFRPKPQSSHRPLSCEASILGVGPAGSFPTGPDGPGSRIISREVEFISLQDGINTATPTGRFTFNIFASLAEFEREIIKERTKAGLEAAKARGRNGGRSGRISSAAIEKAKSAIYFMIPVPKPKR
jgi:hypothetical protein